MTDHDIEGLFEPSGGLAPPPLAAAAPTADQGAPERGIPEVKRPASRWALPGMIVGAVMLTGGFVYSMSQAGGLPERALTDREPSGYAEAPAPAPRLVPAAAAPAEPVLAPEPEYATTPPPPPSHGPSASTSHREQERLRAREEARSRADEARRRYAERLRSPLLVNGGDAGGTAATGAGAAGGPVRLAALSGRDPNSSFLSAAGGAGVDTERATVLANQSALIAQGTLVPGVLETAINSDLPGMLRALVSADVLSFDQQQVLIPRGTRLIGQYRSGIAIGQTRAFVVWTRLITPHGGSMQLGSPGTDALGQAGVSGTVDEHFFRRFGAALLLSIVGSAGQAAANAADDGGDSITINAAGGASRVAEIALQNRVNIPPTIKVRQGSPIRIFVAKDLDFTGTPTAGSVYGGE
jgi:type IV secretion system protein VirB10